MRKLWLVPVLLVMCSMAQAQVAPSGDVLGAHNLSPSGTGPVRQRRRTAGELATGICALHGGDKLLDEALRIRGKKALGIARDGRPLPD